MHNSGWSTILNKEYRTRRDGEIDVIAYKDNYTMYVEVKCDLNYKTIRHAKDQLDRAYKYAPFHNGRLFTMMAGIKNNEIIYRWLPQ